MNTSARKRALHAIQLVVASALLLGFTTVPADAQFGSTRFQGAWDLPEDDPRVLNVYKLTAIGHKPRMFAVTKVYPSRPGGPEDNPQPQFYPVTNVRAEDSLLEKFFGAEPGRMILVVGLIGGEGGNLTLNEVTLRPMAPAPQTAPPSSP